MVEVLKEDVVRHTIGQALEQKLFESPSSFILKLLVQTLEALGDIPK